MKKSEKAPFPVRMMNQNLFFFRVLEVNAKVMKEKEKIQGEFKYLRVRIMSKMMSSYGIHQNLSIKCCGAFF